MSSRRAHEDRHHRHRRDRGGSPQSHPSSSVERKPSHRSRSRDRDREKRSDRSRERGRRRDSYKEESQLSVRLLIDAPLIGGLIGKGGEIVNQMRRDLQTSIEIQDSPMGVKKRVVTVKGDYVTVNKTLYSIAMRLKVVEAKLAELSRDRERDRDSRGKEMCGITILVPLPQVGCLIGKGGDVINGIRQSTGAFVKVAQDTLPGTDEKTMEIKGSERALKECLELIVDQLRSKRAQEKGVATHPYVPSLGDSEPESRDRGGGGTSAVPAASMFPATFNPAMFLPFAGLIPGFQGAQGGVNPFGAMQSTADEDHGFGEDSPARSVVDSGDSVDASNLPAADAFDDDAETKPSAPSSSSPFLSISGNTFKILVPFPATVDTVVLGSDGNGLQVLMKQYGSQIKLLPHDPDNDGVTERTLLITGGCDANDKTIAALYEMMSRKEEREDRKRDATDRFKKL